MSAIRPSSAEPASRDERAGDTTRSRAAGVALLGLLLLAAGCGVSRQASQRLPGAAALPNLRRASEAQLDRIAIETAHVQSLDQQLSSLRAQEDRLYGEVIAAEQAYQRLQGDYDGVQADVSAVNGELAAVRGDLAASQAELEQLRTVLAVTQGDLERARSESQSTSAELAAIREKAQLDDDERQAWIARLERRREALGVEPAAWQSLLVELGLVESESTPGADAAAPGEASEEQAGPADAGSPEGVAPGPESTPGDGADPGGAPAPGDGSGDESADPEGESPSAAGGDEPVDQPATLAHAAASWAGSAEQAGLEAGGEVHEGAGEGGPERATGPPGGSRC
ncbi:MAG: hypothetical protein H6825_14470 [Planctomycetes bacterium]|nr:hypothetical protein [Planctomycetota bacterium]